MTTILFFYPVDEGETFNPSPRTFELLATEPKLVLLSKIKGVRAYREPFTALVADYNAEQLDGGYWCIAVTAEKETIEKYFVL